MHLHNHDQISRFPLGLRLVRLLLPGVAALETEVLHTVGTLPNQNTSSQSPSGGAS